VDIDWEYPGSPNGNAGNQVSPQDSANLLEMLKTAKQLLGTGKLLTMATALKPFNGANGSPMAVRVAPSPQCLFIADHSFLLWSV
jgi:chitinase